MNLRLSQFVLALLMAVPLHLCCWGGLMGAEPEAPCPACLQFMTPEERAAETAPEPVRHCECCDDTLQRDLSPAAITTPRPTTNDLPAIVWGRPESWITSTTADISRQHLCREDHSPPPYGVPIYRRHCALLL